MKPRYYAAITLALAALSPANGGEVAVAGKAKLRPTHDQLAKRKSTGHEITKGAAHFVPAEPGTVQRKQREATSLIDRSTILSFGGFWTIVPKDAVIHSPSNYRARLVTKPTGRLLPWQEFHARNRGWIHTQNVSLSEARGETPLTQETIDTYRRTGRLVVAVCHQGPISMKAAKEDAKTVSKPNPASKS